MKKTIREEIRQKQKEWNKKVIVEEKKKIQK